MAVAVLHEGSMTIHDILIMIVGRQDKEKPTVGLAQLQTAPPAHPGAQSEVTAELARDWTLSLGRMSRALGTEGRCAAFWGVLGEKLDRL